MMKCLVLGCGRVGSLIATDLAQDFKVVVSDIRMDAVDIVETKNVSFDRVDLLALGTLERLIEIHDPDIVVNATASTMGYGILERVIACKKDIVDISFMRQDPRDLMMRALLAHVTVVPDCGIMPGLGNIMAGYAAEQLRNCQSIEIFVGGVPKSPEPPYNYKAPFAPKDVIEEYTREARLKRDWRVIVKPALSDVEEVWIDDYRLEAFNTDGLRTLLSLNVPNLTEKTIRWPGTARQMIDMLADDQFDEAQLFEAWRYRECEEDITFMNVVAKGKTELGDDVIRWRLIDESDDPCKHSSMARTTAFPCTVVARMIARGTINQKGVVMPEELGKDPKLYREIVDALKHKGLAIQCHSCTMYGPVPTLGV